jgi:hypothetical protein
MARKSTAKTIEILCHDPVASCTLCGFETTIAKGKVKVSDLSTLLYAFNKMHGANKCNKGGE